MSLILADTLNSAAMRRGAGEAPPQGRGARAPGVSPCGFVFYLDPKLATIAVVPKDGGVVMVRRSIDPGYGLWVVPGGFVDVGEPVEEAVVRETLEEARLAVRVERLLNVYSYRDSTTVVVAYLTQYLGGELAAGDEALEARVFTPAEIPWEEIPFRSTKAALNDYLKLRA